MRIIGNLLWWLFGGLEAAIGYFTGSLALACTIIGIPYAIQTFKIGLLCLWPFGSTVKKTDSPTGCIRIPLNLFWLIFGGLWACLVHLFFGFILCITIIGIPFAIQTFKIGLLCLWPFGSKVRETNSPTGCIRIPLNLLCLIFGGLWACLMHLFFGFLLCITIIGIPWGKQHFKMAGLSLAPFGKDVELGF